MACTKTALLSSAYIITCLGLVVACGSKPSPPGPLQNVGGSSGAAGEAGAGGSSGGGSSGGGSSGGGGEALDAGTTDAAAPDPDTSDAGPDARAPAGDAAAPEEAGCTLGTLGAGCQGDCPELDDAAEALLDDDAVVVVRRRCEGADGTSYISIGGDFPDGSRGYIYEAEGGELVSMYTTRDEPELCSESSPSTLGFHGRVVHDCAAVNPDDVTTPCDSSGPGNGGGPEACVYEDD